MARPDVEIERSHSHRDLLRVGLGLTGLLLLARRLKKGPLIVARADEGGRLVFLPFEKFKDQVESHVVAIRQALNPAEANNDAQVVQISSRRRRIDGGPKPDIDAGRVRYSSETNTTKAQVSAQTDTGTRDVVDIIDEALAESSSIFGPGGWKGFMGEERK